MERLFTSEGTRRERNISNRNYHGKKDEAMTIENTLNNTERWVTEIA